MADDKIEEIRWGAIILSLIFSIILCIKIYETDFLSISNYVFLLICIVSFMVIFIIYDIQNSKLQIKNRKIDLLEKLEKQIENDNFDLDCKNELCKRITTILSDI